MDIDPVGKYWRMNPETDDLLLGAAELREGMVILAYNRVDFVYKPDEAQLDQILRKNRWFKVSKIHHEPDTVRFVATYENGEKIPWTADNGNPWIVKKDSIPPAEPAYRSGVIVSQYTTRYNPDGTTSIYITESTTGAVTEFIVGGFTTRDVVSELLDEKLPPVNPKAPLFFPPRFQPGTLLWIDPGAKAEDGSDYKSYPDLENLKHHDPEWAIRNLQHKPVTDDPTRWVNQDPNPTRTDITVFKGDIHIVKPDPTEGPQNEMGVDVRRCGFTWSNQNMIGQSVERIHICAKPGHDIREPHVDANGFEYQE